MAFDKLLIKIPTRERGFEWLHSYLDNITNPETKILLSVDEDDNWFNSFPDQGRVMKYACVAFMVGKSKGKIEAINRDINDYIDQFDVLLVGSDDMIPQVKGFDQIILDDMNKHCPDGDGCLWYKTEDAEGELKRRYRRTIKAGTPEFYRKWICMLPVMGKTYYKRFNYVYHPSYKSFHCDNEYTEVAHKMGKIYYIDNQIIKHKHPAWDKEGKDDNLYSINNKNWNADKNNLHKRKMRGFPTS